MSNKKSQFDFRRYGRFAIIIGLIIGVYLSRHAMECFKKQVDDFQLAGVVDDGTSTSLLSDDGNVKKGTKGDYAGNFNKGAGLFGYMAEAIPFCIDRAPFKSPLEAYYAFLAFMGIGLLFTIMEKLITPTWKKELKKKGREDKKRKREVDDAASRMLSARSSKPKKVEAIDVDMGAGSGGGGGSGKMGDLLMGNSDHHSSSGRSARGGAPKNPSRNKGPKKPKKGGMSADKRKKLASLGLSSFEEGNSWLDDDDDEAPASSSKPSRPAPRAPASSSSGLMNAGPASADSVAQRAAPSKPRRKLRIGTAQAPADPNAPFEDEPLSGAANLDPMEERSNLWLPGGRERDPFLYVEPAKAERAGQRDGTRINRAIGGLQAAIEAASEWLDDGQTVQLRLLPGVYRENIKLPSGLALVNHHIPHNLSTDELRFWLTGDEGFDHDHHVVLALPPDADASARVIHSKDTKDIVVAGIHIVGRSELDDDGDKHFGGGVALERVQHADFFLCHMVGHRLAGDGAAMQLRDCGNRRPEDRVLLQDCLIELNATSGHGGAIAVERSNIVLRGCAVQANQAATAGGGLSIRGCTGPVLVDDCNLSNNGVELPGKLPGASRSGWSGEVGHGGGIFVSGSSLHLRRTDLTENSAQGSGGGLFATTSRVMIEGHEDPEQQPSRIAANEAMRGGGVLLSGVLSQNKDKLTALRARNVEFIANRARESGGGVATFRLAALEMNDCGVLQNAVIAEHGEGGGLHANLGSRVKMTRTAINKNVAPFRGGGMAISNSSMRLLGGCSVTENSAPEGDSGGLAFYTMESQYMAELKARGVLEDPVVCAIAPCNVQRNHAKHGVGGVFIGNYSKEPTNSIAFALKNPDLIGQNTIEGSDGSQVRSKRTTSSKPVDLLVLWKGSIRGSDTSPPSGKRILK